jgi:hypothetical protein
MSTQDGVSQRFWKERLQFIKAMSKTSEWPKIGAVDLVPGADVVGIFIAHATVCRMVKEGELDPVVGAYLNGTIGSHAFCALHACTHGAVAMHSPEHEPFEAMVFRLANTICFFDDGYLESHKSHHSRCNHPELDPDYKHAHAKIDELGMGIYVGSQLEWEKLMRPNYGFNWGSVVTKMGAYEVLKMMQGNEDFAEMGNTLQVLILQQFSYICPLISLHVILLHLPSHFAFTRAPCTDLLAG